MQDASLYAAQIISCWCRAHCLNGRLFLLSSLIWLPKAAKSLRICRTCSRHLVLSTLLAIHLAHSCYSSSREGRHRTTAPLNYGRKAMNASQLCAHLAFWYLMPCKFDSRFPALVMSSTEMNTRRVPGTWCFSSRSEALGRRWSPPAPNATTADHRTAPPSLVCSADFPLDPPERHSLM